MSAGFGSNEYDNDNPVRVAAEPTLFDAPIPARAPIGEHRKTAPPLAGRMAANVRRSDSDESWAAAESQERRARGLEAAIVAAFIGQQLTDDQLCARVKGKESSIKTARSRLSRRGVLVKVRTGVSNAGSAMGVWALASSQSEVA